MHKLPSSGHGSGASEQLQDALGELMQAAESGQLDIDYGEQQLRVAAIRLREDMEYICEAGSIPRDGKCGKSQQPVTHLIDSTVLLCAHQELLQLWLLEETAIGAI